MNVLANSIDLRIDDKPARGTSITMFSKACQFGIGVAIL
jgi:hypothetical protein